MATQRKEQIPAPKWDEALASLLKEEYQRKGDELLLEDILRMSKKHNIRFDDIIVTLFELCIEDHWRYFDGNSNEHRFTRDEINKLYRKGRITAADVRFLNGGFSPSGFN